LQPTDPFSCIPIKQNTEIRFGILVREVMRSDIVKNG